MNYLEDLIFNAIDDAVADWSCLIGRDVPAKVAAAVRIAVVEDVEEKIEDAATKVLSDYDTVMNVKAEVQYIVAEFRRLNGTADST